MREAFKHFKNDLPASIVVFFVALPLCLGIAMASGAPLFSGIIAGVIGGVVVGILSGSPLGVSGPAAGLAVVVLDAMVSLGSWEVFLLALVLAGILQVVMGHLKLGIIGYYFPTSVIKGMLAGIGLVIIIKQIPQAVGYAPEVSFSLAQRDGASTVFAFEQLLASLTPAAVISTIVSLSILLVWDIYLSERYKLFRFVQGPMVAVLSGIILYKFLPVYTPYAFAADQLVRIPEFSGVNDFLSNLSRPSFSLEVFMNGRLYVVAVIIALVASLETLLCVEATDKLDPQRRTTPTNRELKAQGVGNIISGLVGGLPITQVIIRSSANISFGGKTKLSAILHGVFILICVLSIPRVLNLIPLSSLAAILFVVGYKLARPSLFKRMYSFGADQFVPFAVTVLGILITDMLSGIAIGLVVGVFFILRNNYKNPYAFEKEENVEAGTYRMVLSEEVSFLNKGHILTYLNSIPDGAKVCIDARRSRYIDFDVREIIADFKRGAVERRIQVEFIGNESYGD